jgi:hypothetical protein
VILNRILLSLVPALMALLLAAGVVDRGPAFDSGIGVTSDGPLKGRGSPNRVLAVRTVFVAGITEEGDNEDRPALGVTVGDEWTADGRAGEVITPPVGLTGPPLVWRCAAPPTGPPLV